MSIGAHREHGSRVGGRFRTNVRAVDMLLRDHLVHGVPVLPGVTFLDVVLRNLEAMQAQEERIALANAVFRAPVAIAGAERERVLLVELRAAVGGWSVRARHHGVCEEGGEGIECFAADVRVNGGDGAVAPQLDLSALRRSAVGCRDLDEAYERARHVGIDHGPFMKAEGEIYELPEALLARVRLSELAETHRQEFRIHPVYLDAATLVPFLYAFGAQQKSSPFIPLAIASFRVHSATPAECWVYVSRSETEVASPDVVHTNLGLYGPDGRLFASFERLSAKRLRSADALVRRGPLPIRSPALAGKSNSSGEPVELLESIESELCVLLGEALAVPAVSVRREVGFYDQGLDSVQLLGVARALEQRWGCKLYPTLLFEYPTVRLLGEYLEQEYGATIASAYSISAAGAGEGGQRPVMIGAEVIGDMGDTLSLVSATVGWTVAEPGHKVAVRPWALWTSELRLADVLPRIVGDVCLRIRSGPAFQATADGFTLRAERKQDYLRFWKEVAVRGACPERVLIWHDSPGNLLDSLNDSIFRVLRLCRSWLRQTKKDSLDVVFVVSRGENEPRADAEALAAFFSSVHGENPRFSGRVVEIVGSVLPRALDECFEREESHLRWEHGQWMRRRWVETPLQAAASPWRHGGVYVITGGAGGLGLMTAKHIARSAKARLVLVGRSVLDSSVAEEVTCLESLGAEVLYISADIARRAEVSRVFSLARARFGGVNGVLHAAGVRRDALVRDKTDAQVAEVIAPKVQGVANLDAETASDALDFFAVYSSVAGAVGNPGQSDYAFANGFVDAFIEARECQRQAGERNGRSVSINWPLWAEGGMSVDPDTAALLKSAFGMIPLETHLGLEALDRAVAGKATRILVVQGDAKKVRASLGLPAVAEGRSEEADGAGGKSARYAARQAPSVPQFPSVAVDLDDIAVVGMSGRYPGARHLGEFWENLREGRDCIVEIPKSRWDNELLFHPDRNHEGTSYGKWGGFIDDVDAFDALFFNIAPREAELMDPQERVFLESVWHAVEDAGTTRAALEGSRVGVFVGVMWSQYQIFGAEEALRGNAKAASSFSASIANRVSYTFNFRGPSLALDTMCSSSITALHLACRSLRDRECDCAVAGGVNLSIHPQKYRFLSFGQFLSSDGRCRSFGEGGDGYVPGEGVGALVLKRLADAVGGRDRIYAVIKASAVNHGGRASGYTVPSPRAQAAVIRDALNVRGIDPSTVSYVEAHGTGTSLGDPIEIEGLASAFRGARAGTCAIGSVKSNIGHLESAAGVAGVTKVVLQLHHKQLVPSLHASPPNPHIDFDKTPFRVQSELAPWVCSSGLRRGAVSSFGAGGANGHVIIEEKSPAVRGREALPSGVGLFVLSARTEERLRVYAAEVSAVLRNPEVSADLEYADVCFTLQVGREAMTHRLAIIGDALSDLPDLLDQCAFGEPVVAGVLRSVVSPDARRHAQSVPTEFGTPWHVVAERWLRGETVDWEALHSGWDVRRISLPGYPFARERHWLPLAEDVVPVVRGGRTHPLLERNASDFSGYAFVTHLTGGESFVADHRVCGESLLPGVVSLEMARAAGESLSGRVVSSLRAVRWPLPCRVGNAGTELRVELSLTTGGARFQVRSGAERDIVSQGEVGFDEPSDTAARVDLDAIRRRLPREIEASSFYSRFTANHFEYGPTLRCVRKVHFNGNEALACLKMHSLAADESASSIMSLSLLDGALQAVAVLVPEGASLRVPYSLDEVKWVGPLATAAFAHVRSLGDEEGASQFSIEITDSQGAVLASIRGFELRAVGSSISYPHRAVGAQQTDADSTVLQAEIAVVQLVSQILGVKVEDIDPAVDMSEYGFDSITLTRFANRVNEQFLVDITPPILFEHRSIRSFCNYLCSQYAEAVARVLRPNDVDSVVDISRRSAQTAGEEVLAAPTSSLLGGAAEPQVAGASSLVSGEPIGSVEPIAIVGIAGIFPQADNVREFWEHLVEGRDSVSEIPANRWDWRQYWSDPPTEPNCTNSKWGGFIREVDKFDAAFFGIMPREAELMDPQQRIVLELVWRAIEDAGRAPSELAGSRTGLFVGVGSLDYSELVRESGCEIGGYTATGLAHSVLVNRISYLLDLRGPSEPVDTACSSSLVAIHRAVESIRCGDCEMAIAGGVNVMLKPTLHIAFGKAGMLSPDGRCKTFDSKANGYVRGEGAGVVVLKPWSRAVADGDQVLALIRSSAVNHGGHTNSLTAPSPTAQADLIVEAHRKAGIDPSTITYIETHGTGTVLGDPIEINGLKQAFGRLYEAQGEPSPVRPHCGLGSVKTNIGHLESAAGIAGILKVVMAMRAGVLPATLHLQEVNPYLKLDATPFYLVTQTRTWSRLLAAEGSEMPRRAGVSSFGFGGVNAHVVLEEAPEIPRSADSAAACELVVLSARSRERLEAYAASLADYLGRERPNLSDVAFTLQCGRDAMDERLAIVTSSVEQLARELGRFVVGEVSDARSVGSARRDKAALAALLGGSEADDVIPSLLATGEWGQLGALWVLGGSVQWASVRRGREPRRVSLPTYPFARKRHWFDSYQPSEPGQDEASKPLGSPRVPDAAYELAVDRGYDGAEVGLTLLDGGIAVVEMRDEANRNMFTDALVGGLAARFAQLAQRSDVKSIIVTGRGPVFSMGASQEGLLSIAGKKNRFTDLPFLYRGLLDAEVPVIAAIQGHASGGGLLFGLYADIVILASEAVYSASFMRYGFTPGMGATWLLKDKLGANTAAEMMFTAKSLRGEELKERGASVLVQPGVDVLASAIADARALCDMPRDSLRVLKREMSRRVLVELPAVFERELRMHEQTFASTEVEQRIARYYEPATGYLDDLLEQIELGTLSVEDAVALDCAEAGE